MTPAEFKRKWARYSGKETAAYQEHFNDLCALLGHPSPAAADPTGNESFCFQKRVVKDAELFALEDSGRIAEEPESERERERGFADVWKRGFFAWEYKGKRKNLDMAYQQLLRYRESLLNPPLLVVCDFDRYVVRWLHAETCSGMREALKGLQRFLATPRVSKFRVFSWADAVVLPDDGIYVFARDDDYFFGVVHSRFHEVWARAQGTQVRERESGFRYTPTTCFETFPFPEPNEQQKIGIAAAVKDLNELRENWLNPPEWTITRVLEFLGSIDGPWSRYVIAPDERGIGTVRYPRLEPRDEDCAKKLAKRTLTNLYNERPAWLAHAHAKLDAAVAAAYRFPVDLTDEQILEKLLALNFDRAAAEKKSATAPKKGSSRPRTAEEMI
jgi:hypothetical protein